MKHWKTKNSQTITRILSGRCNCYLVSHEGKHLLIDTGRKNRWPHLIEHLNQLGVCSGSLVAIVLTHSHFDHAENVAKVKETFPQAAIIIHKNEGDYLKRGDNPIPQGTRLFSKLIITLLAHTFVLRRIRYRPANYDMLVDDTYDLQPLGFPGYLLHTPGHSPGSLSVIVDNEVAIVGDTLFGVFPGSAYPPYAENPKIMIQSWKKLLATGCSLFLPGHGRERSNALLQAEYKKYRTNESA